MTSSPRLSNTSSAPLPARVMSRSALGVVVEHDPPDRDGHGIGDGDGAKRCRRLVEHRHVARQIGIARRRRAPRPRPSWPGCSNLRWRQPASDTWRRSPRSARSARRAPGPQTGTRRAHNLALTPRCVELSTFSCHSPGIECATRMLARVTLLRRRRPDNLQGPPARTRGGQHGAGERRGGPLARRSRSNGKAESPILGVRRRGGGIGRRARLKIE